MDAAARRATLLPRGRITGRLSADRVELRPGAVGGALGPYAAGESLPAVPAPQAGAVDVTVPPNQALTLVPGGYRRIAADLGGSRRDPPGGRMADPLGGALGVSE